MPLSSDCPEPTSVNVPEVAARYSMRILVASGALFVHVSRIWVEERGSVCKLVGALGTADKVVTAASLEYGDDPDGASARNR